MKKVIYSHNINIATRLIAFILCICTLLSMCSSLIAVAVESTDINDTVISETINDMTNSKDNSDKSLFAESDKPIKEPLDEDIDKISADGESHIASYVSRDTVSYWDPTDKAQKIAIDVNEVEDDSEAVTWTSGWYYVDSDVKISGRITVEGEVNLILGTGYYFQALQGVTVSGENSFTIWGQNEDYNEDGYIFVDKAPSYYAGIGGEKGNDGSNITINGGNVSVYSFDCESSAAIGGGYGGDGYNITINGGNINAHGRSSRTEEGAGAAIGGGPNGDGYNIIINDGYVQAYGESAGIGGGSHGDGYNITINGGFVNADGGHYGGSGIGGGQEGNTHDITINGGIIIARASYEGGYAIGCTPEFGDYDHMTFASTDTLWSSVVSEHTHYPQNDWLQYKWVEIMPFDTSGLATVTFDAGEGTFANGNQQVILYIVPGNRFIPTFTDKPIRDGYLFGGWKTIEGSTWSFTKNTIYENITLYADWADAIMGAEYWNPILSSYEVATNVMPVNDTAIWSSGWYVAKDDVTISDRVTIEGDVNLILTTAHTLHIPAGITVPEGSSLTIWSQSEDYSQDGFLRIDSVPYSPAAGIGGTEGVDAGCITINGGIITVSVSAYRYGGGAAIGGAAYCDVADIVINGGIITATGGTSAAAIGGGAYGTFNHITINNGNITANGSYVGIGGEYNDDFTHITIAGGTIVATGSNFAIGNTPNFEDYVHITYGNTATTASDTPVEWFAHKLDSWSNYKWIKILPSSANDVYYITFDANEGIFETGDKQYVISVLKGYALGNVIIPTPFTESYPFVRWETSEGVIWNQNNVIYTDTTYYAIYQNMNEVIYYNPSLNAYDTVACMPLLHDTTILTDGWYYALDNTPFPSRVVIDGSVNIILNNGIDLNIPQGITVSEGNSLTIWGQNKDCTLDGALTINDTDRYNAGIGTEGSSYGTKTLTGYIEINGGKISVQAAHYGAGIGGGYYSDGCNITINGGIIIAKSGTWGGAGIGGGNYGDGYNIIINGGHVTAQGASDLDDGAGIGGGYQGSGHDITINDGIVYADGGASGIGCGGFPGGAYGYGYNITINNGTIVSNGFSGPGIGGGHDTHDILIKNGNVLATSKGGAGIGSYGGNAYNIIITGGIITARGADKATGIGSGYQGNSSNISISNAIVEASGSVGIGAVDGYNSSDITIVNSTVIASGENKAISCTPEFNEFEHITYGNIENTETINIVETSENLLSSWNEYKWIKIFPATNISLIYITFVANNQQIAQVPFIPGNTPSALLFTDAIRTAMIDNYHPLFVGWFDKDGHEFGSVAVTENTTFYAIYDEEYDYASAPEFHKIESIAELQAGAHYIIVATNTATGAPFENGYLTRYSFSAANSDGASNDAFLLKQSEEDYQNGILRVPYETMSVLTITGFLPSTTTASVTFKSNNGLRMKLGTNSSDFTPLFNEAGGNIQISRVDTASQSGFAIYNTTRYLSFSPSSGGQFGLAKYSGSTFEIYTDASEISLGEARYVEYAPLGLSITDFQVGDDMLIVYTDNKTGISYALTNGANGYYAVPVTVENNVLIGDDITTAISTDRRNTWEFSENWQVMTDGVWGFDTNDNYNVLRTRLSRGVFDLWVSSSALVRDTSSGSTAQVFFYIDNTDSTNPQIRLHGDRTIANRYLGWKDGDFSANSLPFDDSITVRIYGKQLVGTTYQTKYVRVTDLNLLSQFSATDSFILVINNNGLRQAIGYNLTGNTWRYDVNPLIDEDGVQYIMVNNTTPIVFNGVFTGYSEPGGSSPQYVTFDRLTLASYGYAFYPQNLNTTQTTNGITTWTPGVPFRTNQNSTGRLEYNEKNGDTIYIRGNGGSTYLCYGWYGEYGVGYYAGAREDPNRVSIEIYTPTSDSYHRVRYHDVNGIIYDNVYTQGSFTLRQPDDLWVMPDGTVVQDRTEGSSPYIFVGWSTDDMYSGNAFLTQDESCNIYGSITLDDGSPFSSVIAEVREKYSLLGHCNPEILNTVTINSLGDYIDANGDIYLFPIYAVRGYDTSVAATEIQDGGTNKQIIGIADWKPYQRDDDAFSKAEVERWLGSIEVEIYKDGVQWGTTETMYFSYHNDDAADLNIKFIWDNIVNDKYNGNLYDFMSDMGGDPENIDKSLWPAYDQIGHFKLDAVYAEQGKSESGLKYYYNWVTEHGGQLDNVAGGTTVKLYVTTVYNVKYYLQDENGDYNEIMSSEWQNANRYSTPGTSEKFALDDTSANYHVTNSNLADLLIECETDALGNTEFVTENMARGLSDKFTYLINAHNNIIPIAKTPESLVPSGYSLLSTAWVLKNSTGNKVSNISYSSTYSLSGTSYGTGNTSSAYHDGVATYESDMPYTFHLYADIGHVLKITKIVSGNMGNKVEKFTFTLTLNTVDGPFTGDLEYQKDDDDETYTLTAVDGKYTFTLAHNETISITGLPSDIQYTIEEVGDNAKKYKTSIATSNHPDDDPIDGKIITDVLNDETSIIYTNTIESLIPTDATIVYGWVGVMMIFVTLLCIIVFVHKRYGAKI